MSKEKMRDLWKNHPKEKDEFIDKYDSLLDEVEKEVKDTDKLFKEYKEVKKKIEKFTKKGKKEKKNKLPTKEEYMKWIGDAFERDGLKSYSHKPHLQDLPYDLRTNDPSKLLERREALKKKIRENWKESEDMYNELFGSKMGLDFAFDWSKDRKVWKSEMDKFYKEDKARVQEKIEKAKEFNELWSEVRKRVKKGAKRDNVDLWCTNWADKLSKDGAISVLQPSELYIQDTQGFKKGEYDYIFYEYDIGGVSGNGWRGEMSRALESLRDLKKATHIQKVDNLLEIMKEVSYSPKGVQIQGDKVAVYSEVYPELEEVYQDAGGDAEAKRLIKLDKDLGKKRNERKDYTQHMKLIDGKLESLGVPLYD